MNYTALKAAVAGRGFSRLADADLGQAVNDALHELDGLEPRWPYLLATTTGTAPLTVSDYADITVVLNTATSMPVTYVDYEELASWAGDLTAAAVDPAWWYFTPGSTTSLSTYPVTGRSLKVVYYKSTSDLSAGSDTPLAPSRWHQLLVDMAVRNAHVMRDMDVPATLELAIQRKTAAMRTDLLYRQVQGPSMVLRMGCEDY